MRNALVLTAIYFIGACSAFGPGTIPKDQFDYGRALADAQHEQLLLNIVKLRYLEAPMFVEVSSIINQYSVEGEIGFSTSWRDIHSNSAATAARYYDRPTITYAPVKGRDFTESLLTPIPPGALLFLVQSGWPVDFVFSTCVQAMNGHYNRGGSRAHGLMVPEATFSEVIDKMMRVQGSGAIGMRVEGRGADQTASFVFRRRPTKDIEADRIRLRELLHVDPDIQQFRVVYGADSNSDTEIAMLTRSLFEIMAELCSQVDIPPEHTAAGRAAPAVWSEAAEAHRLIRIQSGESAPETAFVSVSYKDKTFWIDDSDLISKRTFAFVTILFNLTRTGTTGGGPIVTVAS
jgi:hypothetical protein